MEVSSNSGLHQCEKFQPNLKMVPKKVHSIPECLLKGTQELNEPIIMIAKPKKLKRQFKFLKDKIDLGLKLSNTDS